MKILSRKLFVSAVVGFVCACLPASSKAVTLDVPDSNAPWLAFMNVFELPANGGGFVFGSPWGIGDLVANFDDPNNQLILSPNTIGDPNEFWYQCVGGATPPDCGGPGAPGNKNMDANLYIEETGPLAGQTVTFQGVVASNTLTPAHTTRAFIRDFAPDYSSFVESTVDLTTTGPFSVTLDTINDPARHVQYGFQTVGENVWITDVAPFGNIVINTIPEPNSMLGLGLGLAALTGFVRRRR